MLAQVIQGRGGGGVALTEIEKEKNCQKIREIEGAHSRKNKQILHLLGFEPGTS